MTDTPMHPAAMDARVGVEAVAEMERLPSTASYRTLDEEELAMARMIASGVAPPPSDRSAYEITMQWSTWRRAGSHSFVVGPETAARIADRIKAGDVPTEPAAPAYFAFGTPPVNFRASCRLRGAYLYRGEIGRITFLSDAADMAEAEHLTILTPSVFEDRDLDNLKRSLIAQRPRRDIGDEAMDLARTMAAHAGNDDPADLDALAERMQGLADVMDGRGDPGRMTMVAKLIDGTMGTLRGDPNPLLPKAARWVLVAADEARRLDAGYGAHEYENEDQMARTWRESREMPTKRRGGPILLP